MFWISSWKSKQNKTKKIWLPHDVWNSNKRMTKTGFACTVTVNCRRFGFLFFISFMHKNYSDRKKIPYFVQLISGKYVKNATKKNKAQIWSANILVLGNALNTLSFIFGKSKYDQKSSNAGASKARFTTF